MTTGTFVYGLDDKPTHAWGFPVDEAKTMQAAVFAAFDRGLGVRATFHVQLGKGLGTRTLYLTPAVPFHFAFLDSLGGEVDSELLERFTQAIDAGEEIHLPAERMPAENA